MDGCTVDFLVMRSVWSDKCLMYYEIRFSGSGEEMDRLFNWVSEGGGIRINLPKWGGESDSLYEILKKQA